MYCKSPLAIADVLHTRQHVRIRAGKLTRIREREHTHTHTHTYTHTTQAIIAQRRQVQKAVGDKSHSRLGLIQEVAKWERRGREHGREGVGLWARADARGDGSMTFEGVSFDYQAD